MGKGSGVELGVGVRVLVGVLEGTGVLVGVKLGVAVPGSGVVSVGTYWEEDVGFSASSADPTLQAASRQADRKKKNSLRCKT